MRIDAIRSYIPWLFIPVPFIFYYLTMCPSIGLGDTALLLDSMIRLSLSSHINNHNLTILIGHIFQLVVPGEIAFRGNLVSVFFGAIAVVSVYFLALRMTGRVLVSAIAGATIMVSHSLWWHSTIAEVYAANACFTVWIAYCLFRYGEIGTRFLYMASFLAGLALFNHLEMGFWIPAIGAVIILNHKNDIKKLLIIGLKSMLFFLIGFLPYAAVLINDIVRSRSAKQIFYWAIGGDFQSIMFKSGFFQGLGDFLILAVMNYPSPYLLFIIVGIYFGFRSNRYRKLFIVMAVGFCINTLFFMQFPTWDKFAHLLSSFLMMGIAGITGIDIATQKWMADSALFRNAVIALISIGIVVPIMLYAEIPLWSRNPDSYWYARFNNDYTENIHDGSAYIANPDKHAYLDIPIIANLIFKKVPPHAILVDDDSRTFYPLALYYQRYYRKRPDMTIMLINSWSFKNWGSTEQDLAAIIRTSLNRRPVFLISHMYPYTNLIEDLFADGIVTEKYTLDARHWIYRLLTKEMANPSSIAILDIVSAVQDVNFNRNSGFIAKNEFSSDETIMARVLVNKNDSLTVVTLAWKDGSKRLVYKSLPFKMPHRDVLIFSSLEVPSKEPGTWTVEVLVNGLPSRMKKFRIK